MIYLTSDQHYFHNNIIKYCNRPFLTVEEMNEGLISNYNSIVNPEDTCYFLGDFTFSFEKAKLILPRLNGKKILIAGNHDFCHPGNRKSNTPEKLFYWIKEYESIGFEKVALEDFLEINGIKFRLAHLPYIDPTDIWDDGKVRYAKQRIADDGIPLLNGHVHDSWLTKTTPSGTLMINVGVDQWNMKPVAIEKIKELYEKNCK